MHYFIETNGAVHQTEPTQELGGDAIPNMAPEGLCGTRHGEDKFGLLQLRAILMGSNGILGNLRCRWLWLWLAISMLLVPACAAGPDHTNNQPNAGQQQARRDESAVLDVPERAEFYNLTLNPPAREAEALVQKGEYKQALGALDRSRKEYRNAGQKLGELYCLERMGWLQREQGDYKKALANLEKAKELGVELHGDAAEIDADLGDVYLFSGDITKALRHYNLALSTLKDFDFPTSYMAPPSQAEMAELIRKNVAIIHAHDNLGMLYFFKNDLPQALEHLKKADELISKVQAVADHWLYGMFFTPPRIFHIGVGYCRTNQGSVLAAMGKKEKAWHKFKEGKEAFAGVGDGYGLMVNEAFTHQTRFRQGLVKLNDEYLSEVDDYLRRAGAMGAPELVWRVAYEVGLGLAQEGKSERARQYLEQAINVLESTRARLGQDSIKIMFAVSVEQVYTKMIELLFDLGRYEEGFEYLERAKARAFLDILGGRPIRVKSEVPPELVKKYQDVQTRLDKTIRQMRDQQIGKGKDLYGQYLQLLKERKEILAEIKNKSLEYASSTAVATASLKEVAALLQPKTTLVSYLVTPKRTLIWLVSRSEVRAVASQVPADRLAELVNLYRDAIASRQDLLILELGLKLYQLLIAPAKPHLKGVESLMLVPHSSLYYLPFSSLMLSREHYLVQDFIINTLPNASSLIYLERRKAEGVNSLLALGNPYREGDEPDLTFAGKEIRAIAKRFKASQLLTGKKATESALKTNRTQKTLAVHLAAHGRFNAEEPLKSAVLLAADDKNDGNLESFEVFALDLPTKLLVLSACQTGLGGLRGGGEVEGLNRAFIYAGADAVLASLWSVPDQSTYELMNYFYEDFAKMPAAAALRQAQIKLMKKYASPFYWAAFYLTGL